MFFALITLLSALSLATVAGWFSIIGFMAIYAGAPMYALVMGAVMEAAKLVTASWLYRNWDDASWKLKVPLLYFVFALMVATSIGVFGFLSKAHLEQTSATLDNAPRIEQLNYQIQREEELIADNDKMIAQLDQVVQVLTDAQRIRGRDGSIAVRQSQAAQRQSLREDSTAARNRIDELNKERFVLESEVRKLELEVGPIRYIAELFYGVKEETNENIEAAVRFFTLLLVSTLDPLAVILLIAANHTLIKRRNEKENTAKKNNLRGEDPVQSEKIDQEESKGTYSKTSDPPQPPTAGPSATTTAQAPEVKSAEVPFPILSAPSRSFPGEIDETQNSELPITETVRSASTEFDTQAQQTDDIVGSPARVDEDVLGVEDAGQEVQSPTPIRQQETGLEDQTDFFDVGRKVIGARSPTPTQVLTRPDSLATDVVATNTTKTPWMHQAPILRELLGDNPHFTPQKVIEKHIPDIQRTAGDSPGKYPRTLGWLTEFRGK